MNVPICALFVVLLLGLNSCQGKDKGKLTKSQKLALKKFKKDMPEDIPYDWMKNDTIILRYLKVKDWNVAGALSLMKATVLYRKKEKIDTILEEDFADVEKAYAIYSDGVDKKGQPIMAAFYGHWDLLNAMTKFRIHRVLRYAKQKREFVFQKSLEAMERGEPSLWNMIGNFKDFPETNLCPYCLQMQLQFADTTDKYYPGSLDKLCIIKVPLAFSIVLAVVETTQSEDTTGRRVMFKEGEDFESYLFKDIERDQLPKSFGGTREYKEVDEHGPSDSLIDVPALRHIKHGTELDDVKGVVNDDTIVQLITKLLEIN